MIKFNQQTNWKYILIVVILAVIVGGGILAYQYWWLPKQETKPPEITLKDETAGWQTYRNEEYGFEVKYPVSWHFDDSYVNNNGQEFVTFISSDVFEESSQLMLGIRKKGSNADIGLPTGRALDEFIQQGTVNIGGTIVKIYYMLGENNTVSSVYFNDYGGITEVKNFEIATSLDFMNSPKLNNIEKNLDFQNSKKILESLKFSD